MLPTSSLNYKLLIYSAYYFFNKFPIWIEVAKWPFLMNFLNAIATQSPLSETNIYPFLACSPQDLHFF